MFPFAVLAIVSTSIPANAVPVPNDSLQDFKLDARDLDIVVSSIAKRGISEDIRTPLLMKRSSSEASQSDNVTNAVDPKTFFSTPPTGKVNPVQQRQPDDNVVNPGIKVDPKNPGTIAPTMNLKMGEYDDFDRWDTRHPPYSIAKFKQHKDLMDIKKANKPLRESFRTLKDLEAQQQNVQTQK